MINASEFAIAVPEPRYMVVDKSEKSTEQGAATRRVLIVEDNVDAAETLQLLLRMAGYETRAVHHGTGALEAARDFKPGAVLLDIGLPGKDGYEVARELRALPHMKSALLVALTGYGDDEDRERASAAGFDTLEVKPVEPDALDAILSRYFKSAGR